MLRSRVSFALFFLAVFVHAQPPGGRGAATTPNGRTPTIEERTAGMQKLDGYFPLYWDERTGSSVARNPALRYRFSVRHRSRRRAGLERHRARSRPGRRRTLVSFQRVGPKVLMVQAQRIVPLLQRQSRRAALGGRFVREVGAVGLHRRGREQRPRAGGCHRFLPARRPRRRATRCARAPTASIARAAPSTWRAPKRSPRTPRSK